MLSHSVVRCFQPRFRSTFRLILSQTAKMSSNSDVVERIMVVPMTVDHVAQVHNLLTTTFRTDEPMNKNLNLTLDDCNGAFMGLSEYCASLGVSFVAVDSETDRIVGIRLSTIKERSDQHHDDHSGIPPKMATLLTFLDHLSAGLFDKVPVEVQKIFKFEIVCVNEDYRRHGIAKKSVGASLALAKQLDMDAIATTATSFKTQSLFEKLGFVALNTIPFEEYRDAQGQSVFHQMPAENKLAKLMVKYLKDF